MKFGENLYNLRKSAKISQEKLAEEVGVSRQSVSKWENGESYPEMDNMLKICKIFAFLYAKSHLLLVLDSGLVELSFSEQK